MPKLRDRLKLGFHLLAIVLLSALTLRPGLAEHAARDAHAGSKASKSGEPSGSRSPAGEDAGRGAAKPDAHAPHGDDVKHHEGTPPGGNETVKDVNPSVPGGKDSGAIDTNIAPSRRLDKKPNKIEEGKSTIESPATRDLRRRMLSVPPTPSHPARNAIGVPVPQHESVDRRDIAHPNSVAAPPKSPAGTTAVPASTGSHVTKAEAGVDHHVPNANPIITPPAANRGAITGTGLTHHNFGPSQIGGPKASVAGVNGTTIKPKH
jgi:hypothetical protein